MSRSNFPVIRLAVSLFNHVKDNRPRQEEVTWEQLYTRLSRFTTRTSKDGPLWSPTLYPPESTRAKSNVLAVSCFVLDYDKGANPDQFAANWNRWEYAIHTTFSHTEANPRFRVIFPLKLPIPAADWSFTYARMAEALGGEAIDPACKDCSRIYYLPAYPPGSVGTAWRHAGALLDGDAFRRPSIDRLIAMARDHLADGRNESGMWLASQMRDNGYTETETANASWEREVPREKLRPNGTVDVYDRDEWIETVRKAYGRSPREPWPANGRRAITAPAPEETNEAPGSDEPDKCPAEETMARAFANDKRERILYVSPSQWYFYESSGGWVSRDQDFVFREIVDWMRRYRKETGRAFGVTARKANAVLSLLKAYLGPHVEEEFDANPDWIPLKNGIFDVRTGELKKHSPANMVRWVLPYDFNADAEAPRFNAFLEEMLVREDGSACGEWVEAILEWLGYCLVPDANTAQTSMVWVGPGGNGKGTLERLMMQLIGSHRCASPSIEMMHDPYHVAPLIGQFACFLDEPSAAGLRKNGNVFKKITGGDRIQARNPGYRVFEFLPLCRITLLCNDIPATRDLSRGFFRRLLIIMFRVTPENPDRLLDKTLTEELSGIFNMALAGLRRLRERGYMFADLPESEKLKAEYRASQDVVEQWVDTACVVDKEQSTMASTVFPSFQGWCRSNGIKEADIPTSWHFGRRLTDLLIRRKAIGPKDDPTPMGRFEGFENPQRARRGIGIL